MRGCSICRRKGIANTLDFATVGRTLRNYGRLVVKELVTYRKGIDLAAAYGLATAGLVGWCLSRSRGTSART